MPPERAALPGNPDPPQATARPRRRWFGVLLTILTLLICYQTYYCVRLQKTPGWDASLGFITLQSSLEHGDFNRIHHPALGNLNEDRAEFISWWTPGQYLIPHWVSKTLGIDIGTALRLVSVACSWGGLAGLCLLYRKLGFDRTCVYLSLIVICSQGYFLKISRIYLGGDLLFFAAAPFIALGLLSARGSWGRRALLVAVMCFAALFLKASSLALFVALMIYLALEILGWPGRLPHSARDWRPALRPLLILGGVFVFYVLATQFVYLSRGVTISASVGTLAPFSWDRSWGILVALAGPLYGAFYFLEDYGSKLFFIPVAVLSLLAIGKLSMSRKSEGGRDYRRMLVAHYLAFTFFFAFAYLKGMDVSYEPRHFRFMGLVLLPGLIQALLSFRPQLAIAGAVALLSFFSVAVYHRQYFTGPIPVDSSSRWGIRQPVSNASLAAIHRIDDTEVTARTVVFNGFGACPALLLEFNRGRRLQDDNMVNFGFQYTGRATTPVPWYHGEVESIVLLVAKNNPWYFGSSLPEIARTFERPLRVVPYFENDEMIIYTGSVH